MAGALIIGALCALTVVVNANAAWPTLQGKASVFGNDPLIGFHDHMDSGITASGGKTSDGGIAVKNPAIGWQRSWARYGGGWWWVCPPKFMHLKCHLLRQTDAGPGANRTVDVTAVAARRAWGILAWRFPTDEGTWRLRFRGHRRHKPPRR